ncbi:MAG: nucleotide sugar dehydrogenase, partial [Thermomicrobiaceae bacterium]|nr:nucleotide sugar dehydrogenase [Thermomicrobiaceae bacterium]
MATISIVGTGYVGLVQGAAFADLGNQVCGIDIDEGKIARLKQGISPIYEPGLDELVARNVKAGRLRFTTSYEEAIPQSDFVFICVNTPSSFDGDADMRAVRAAAESIGRNLAGHTIVVNKSTMPIGSGDLVTSIIEQHKPADATFAVVSNPEFLREGAAVQDVFHPTRVVLGAEDRAAAEQVAELYRSVNAPVLITDRRSAEMIKYASNAFLATKISFINEIAQICERVGADVKVVAKGMGYDPRIGPLFLEAGIGFGGSCFEGHETVFALNSPNVATRSFASLFEQGGKPVRGDTVEVVVPEDQRVLAFDLATGQPTLAEVKAVTRRRYQGTMVTITTSMGRSLRVTADHPVILKGETGFEIVPASQVRPGDGMLALNSLPAVEPVTHVNLIDLLAGTELEKDVHVTALDGSFSQLYDQYGPFVPEGVLK